MGDYQARATGAQDGQPRRVRLVVQPREARRGDTVVVNRDRLEQVLSQFRPSELRRGLVDKLRIVEADGAPINKTTPRETMVQQLVAYASAPAPCAQLPARPRLSFDDVWHDCLQQSYEPVENNGHASEDQLQAKVEALLEHYLRNAFRVAGMSTGAERPRLVVAVGKASSQERKAERAALSSRWSARYRDAGYHAMRRLYRHMLADTRTYREDEDVALSLEHAAQAYLKRRIGELAEAPRGRGTDEGHETSEEEQGEEEGEEAPDALRDAPAVSYELEFDNNQDGKRFHGEPNPGSGVFVYLAIKVEEAQRPAGRA
jgi:hypothetical protein